ncbi:MAG: UDP-N-acetylenolpyruvoylglucosamine reductase [Anaerolineae bacterium]|nr:MAG: UDP-N-acetylenolpyruvoylglucosamine reductase [Anaerolineae bacterium]
MKALSPDFAKPSVYAKQLEEIAHQLGLELHKQIPLARYTAARIGGKAEFLIEVNSSAKLKQLISLIWKNDIPYTLLGGGSNVLISDEGLPGLVIINRARGRARVRFDMNDEPAIVWADAGVNLSHLARQAAEHGLSGLEWACGIPGTLGGAIVNNAGAFDGDMAGNLVMVTILHRKWENHQVRPAQEQWTVAEMEYRYRSSRLKTHPNQAIVLSALLRLERSDPIKIKTKMDEFNQRRRKTQPPGASLGSMFKNPPGDFAGRLIEAAGLKGLTVGDAMISPLHANFFINLGNASANNVWQLIQLARQAVVAKFGIELELEIQPLGIFPEFAPQNAGNPSLEVENE